MKENWFKELLYKIKILKPKYKELEKTGELPTIQERIYYRADGLDSEYILANMRKKWKKDNM